MRLRSALAAPGLYFVLVLHSLRALAALARVLALEWFTLSTLLKEEVLICQKQSISPETVAAHCKRETGSRLFEVEYASGNVLCQGTGEKQR